MVNPSSNSISARTLPPRRVWFDEFLLCDVEEEREIVQIGAGNAHSGYLTVDGEVWVCGDSRACGYAQAIAFNPTAHELRLGPHTLWEWTHWNSMCVVHGQRDCSCFECKRHNDALLPDVAVDSTVMTEVYLFEPFDSLAVGYDFTAAKFAKGNRIVSTNAWNDKHLQIAASKNLRLRPMLLGTHYAFVCQWAGATDRHMQCLTLLADHNSSKLCLSWLNMESSLSVNNILSNIYIDYGGHVCQRVPGVHVSDWDLDEALCVCDSSACTGACMHVWLPSRPLLAAHHGPFGHVQELFFGSSSSPSPPRTAFSRSCSHKQQHRCSLRPGVGPRTMNRVPGQENCCGSVKTRQKSLHTHQSACELSFGSLRASVLFIGTPPVNPRTGTLCIHYIQHLRRY